MIFSFFRKPTAEKPNLSQPEKTAVLPERNAGQIHQEFLDQALEKGQTEYVEFLLGCPWVELRKQLKIGEFQFNVFKVLRSERANHLLSVIFVDNGNGKLIPRFIYKSNTNKSWCVATGLKEDKTSISYLKGKHSGAYGYETKLVPALQKALDDLASEPEEVYADIIERFYSDSCRKSMRDDFSSDTYEKEIKYVEIGSQRQFLAEGYLPGNLTAEDASDYFKSLDDDFPAGFIPDFSKIAENTRISDSVIYKTYPARLGSHTIQWEMAYDKEGRIWIERISFTPVKVSSYGTQSNILVVGLLGHKPFEYAFQASGLKKGEYKELPGAKEDDPQRIIDITPLLDKLKPIRQYRKQRVI